MSCFLANSFARLRSRAATATTWKDARVRLAGLGQVDGREVDGEVPRIRKIMSPRTEAKGRSPGGRGDGGRTRVLKRRDLGQAIIKSPNT